MTEAVAKTARRGRNPVLGINICEGCFAQDVKDAPTCYKCGARFLTPQEIAAVEAEEAKTDLDRAREKAQAALSGAGAKAATARASLNAAGEVALQAAANTRAGRNLKDYWAGWALVAVVLVVGIGVVNLAIRVGKQSATADAIRHETATAPTSLPITSTIAQNSGAQTFAQSQRVASPPWVRCPDCNSKGMCAQCDPANPAVNVLLTHHGGGGRHRAGLCISCGGTGKRGELNQYGILPDCTICRGTGRCWLCGGTGRCQTCEGAGRITAANAAQLQQARQQGQIQSQQIQQHTEQHYDWTRTN